MTRAYDDAFDRQHADEFPEEQDVTCLHCGTGGLHWERVTAPDGRSDRPMLFTDEMRRHVCTPKASDFEAFE